jgi:hypothetical protein
VYVVVNGRASYADPSIYKMESLYGTILASLKRDAPFNISLFMF